MKALFAALFLALLLSCTGDIKFDPAPPPPPQVLKWTTLPNPDPDSFNAARKNDDIFFLDSQIGFAITSSGKVLKTTTEGNTWSTIFETGAYFRCMGWADEQNGWVGNLNGQGGDILYQTRDGGQNWELVPGLAESGLIGLCGIHVVNQNVVYGAGRVFGPAHVIKTADGGDSWTVFDMSAHAGFLIDIYFIDETNGFVIGGTHPDLDRSTTILLATTDGGQTWEPRYTTQRLNEWGWKFSFPTQNLGFASIQTFRPENSGFEEHILKTTDGGLTWTEISIGRQNYSIQGIGFTDAQNGWVGSWHGDRPTLFTTDGGVTWEEADFGVRLNRIRFLTNGFGYGIGSEIYKYSPQ